MGKNLVPWKSPPTARVIQFNAAEDIERRFECELTTLMFEGEGAPESVLDCPNFVLLPPDVLHLGNDITNHEALELLDLQNFDDEFGEGDSSDSEEEGKPEFGQDWVFKKLESVKAAGCDEFEDMLLGSVMKPDDIDVTFDDIHIDPSVIRSLRALTSLAGIDPEAFTYGVLAKERILGVLLHGPPGTGKTLLAKAVAKEAHTIFLHISAADFLSKWLGHHVKFVRAIFSLARKLDPCVIFMDEADSIFRNRTSDDNEFRREVQSQFLLEWDGVQGGGRRGFFMAATNRIDDIDPAFLRRLPRRIFISPPSAADREAILKLQLRGEELDQDVDLTKLAKMTVSYTGSDLKSLCVTAALAALYDRLLDRHGNVRMRPQRKKSRRKTMRRVLSFRHFERAMAEVGATKEATQKGADEYVAEEKSEEIDDELIASFKPFGQMYAENDS